MRATNVSQPPTALLIVVSYAPSVTGKNGDCVGPPTTASHGSYTTTEFTHSPPEAPRYVEYTRSS